MRRLLTIGLFLIAVLGGCNGGRVLSIDQMTRIDPPVVVVTEKSPPAPIPTPTPSPEVKPAAKARCLVFSTDNCPHCDTLEREIGKLPQHGWTVGRDAASHFQLVYAGDQAGQALVATHNVREFPTCIMVDAAGRAVARRAGSASAVVISNWFRANYPDNSPRPISASPTIESQDSPQATPSFFRFRRR